MSKVSIIIPSRNEQFLSQTINDLLSKATGDIEIIAALDGYWPNPPLSDDTRIIQLHRGKPMGMRAGINAGVGIAKGKYIMKLDGHCMVAEGFDEALQADCEPNWIVIPRRYSLDAENWDRFPKTPIDYEYLRYPYYKPDEVGIHGTIWPARARERLDIEIDENMAFQGSCWFMHRDYFFNLGGMSEEGYGTFIGEPQEIGNKAWLSGGAIMTNKKTWYAHLHKGKKYGRGYFMDKRETTKGNAYSVDFWINNRWEGRTHDLDYLVQKFWPVPTWPDNYKEILNWKL